MKILTHTLYFPPQVGGLETHVLTLNQALQKRGHTVEVVTSHTISSSPKQEEFENVPVHRVSCPGKSILGWVITSILSIPKMWSLSENTDLIHAHTFPSIVPCLPLIWFKKIPCVATMHTSHFLKLAKKPIWKLILKFLLKQPKFILAPSIEIKDVSIEIAPGIQAYSMVNAVDIQRFNSVAPAFLPKDDEIIIVIPRRLYHKNGVEYAIKALPYIRENHNAHLYLIGDGPEKERLEKMVQEKNIKDFVHFLGNIPNSQMPAYISSAHIILIPSLLEATSIAALEAMACERIIVASNIGGLPEIITEETGRLSEAANPQDISDKINEILNLSVEKRIEMGKKAREIVVNHWSTEKLAEDIEKFYFKALVKE